MLIQSKAPVWLYGTASEHSVFYQYNFQNAEHIFATMLQTETPYYQPIPKPPAPFAKNTMVYETDPEYGCSNPKDDFSGCDASWALMMYGCQNIHVVGAGLYSWFSAYGQECSEFQPPMDDESTQLTGLPQSILKPARRHWST